MSKFPEANKSFGQHFLSSPHVIKKITTPMPEGTDAIVEVGPGPAVLTPHLTAHGKEVFVIEMDERFVEKLSEVVGEDHVHRGDALKYDWQSFLMEHNFSHLWLVSNLPYNVSVPLTLSFLRIPQIKNMTLMYQKEVADKILPRDLRNTMNSLHVLCRSQFELKQVVHAPPGAFVPPPKVDSLVLHFKRREKADIELQNIDPFESFLRLTFSQKRKQLGGILRSDWGGDITTRVLDNAQIEPTIRAEALSYEDILRLYSTYSQILSEGV
jgi:16S rRNA (adenine1518-N6/adenine1519-N6)-dimethyltransferase